MFVFADIGGSAAMMQRLGMRTWGRPVSSADPGGPGRARPAAFLSEHTVHRHLANILRKLNLSSRAAAAAWGCAPGWYEPGPVGPSAAAG